LRTATSTVDIEVLRRVEVRSGHALRAAAPQAWLSGEIEGGPCRPAAAEHAMHVKAAGQAGVRCL